MSYIDDLMQFGLTRQESAIYYALLSDHDQNGFEPQMYLNINDSELFAGSMSYQDYCRVRGVYIGDMFYLVTEKGIVSYNIQKDYEQTGTLKWEA